SVRAAMRCKKAGVDVIVASGHEGGFHTHWQPIHSMVLFPAVVEAVSDEKTLVVGGGGVSDGKSLVASLALGCDGVLMGTRFLATQESDFPPLWKQAVVDAQDRGSLIARGYVGPARWLRNARSEEHARNTLQKAPGVFLGTPDDSASAEGMSLINYENESIKAVYEGDKEKAMMAGGEVAQRINDMPKVEDLVQSIVKEAEETLANMPKKYLG
ncbi:MAG: nitronate monooxygenase, partial [Deltaproteobacteria bacterium]|nr:nitronate monooxygenase [Deltaproteobacteria bacterium]